MIMTGMPMGLSPACELYTSHDKLLVTSCRRDFGANILPMLDDTSGNQGGPNGQSLANKTARDIALRKAQIGEVISMEKSTIEAVQELPMLGHIIRTVPEVSLAILPKRTERQLGRIKRLLDRLQLVDDPVPRWSLRASPDEAYSVNGGEISCNRVTGGGTAMRIRYLYAEAVKGLTRGFKHKQEFSINAINELIFLEAFWDLRRPQIRRVLESVQLPPIDIKHISDAS